MILNLMALAALVAWAVCVNQIVRRPSRMADSLPSWIAGLGSILVCVIELVR